MRLMNMAQKNYYFLAAPVFTPTQGNYHPDELTTFSLATATTGSTIKYCTVSFTAATETTATCTPNLDYVSPVAFVAKTNTKVIAKATKTTWTDSDTVTGIFKVKGDVDTNNTVDVLDAIKTLKAVFDSTLLNNLMDLDKKPAGGYGDNKVDLLDVIEIISIIF